MTETKGSSMYSNLPCCQAVVAAGSTTRRLGPTCCAASYTTWCPAGASILQAGELVVGVAATCTRPSFTVTATRLPVRRTSNCVPIAVTLKPPARTTNGRVLSCLTAKKASPSFSSAWGCVPLKSMATTDCAPRARLDPSGRVAARFTATAELSLVIELSGRMASRSPEPKTPSIKSTTAATPTGGQTRHRTPGLTESVAGADVADCVELEDFNCSRNWVSASGDINARRLARSGDNDSLSRACQSGNRRSKALLLRGSASHHCTQLTISSTARSSPCRQISQSLADSSRCVSSSTGFLLVVADPLQGR